MKMDGFYNRFNVKKGTMKGQSYAVVATAGDDDEVVEAAAAGARRAARSSNDWRRHCQYFARITSTLVAN
jgi:hypothetical protein